MPTESFSAVIHKENSKVGIAGLPNTFRLLGFLRYGWTWGLGDKETGGNSRKIYKLRSFSLSPQPPCSPSPNFTGKSLIRTVLLQVL